MTASYYESLTSRGTETEKSMRIYLYANKAGQDSEVDDLTDIVPESLETAMDDVYSFGAIDYYELFRFKADDSSYEHPQLSSSDNILVDFRNWLQNDDGMTNGTGKDLKANHDGAHLLVHDFGCDTDYVSAENADSCDYPSAFVRGVAAWTSVDCTNEGHGIVRNSAIQEPFHCFIRYHDQDIYELVNADTSSEQDDHLREHALGKVTDSGSNNITPMLTYHAFDYDQVGDCTGTGQTPYLWTQNLTTCTKKAIELTANDLC